MSFIGHLTDLLPRSPCDMRLKAVALEGSLPETEDSPPLPLSDDPSQAFLNESPYGCPLLGS